MGSAAYDLANVASGALDGYWELNLSIWDVAAGALLVEEAGGKVVYLPKNAGFHWWLAIRPCVSGFLLRWQWWMLIDGCNTFNNID